MPKLKYKMAAILDVFIRYNGSRIAGLSLSICYLNHPVAAPLNESRLSGRCEKVFRLH